jgi:hypothetical protein
MSATPINLAANQSHRISQEKNDKLHGLENSSKECIHLIIAVEY